MKFAVFCMLLVASSCSFASEPLLSKKFDSCMDSAKGVTSDMLDCIGAEVKRQDIHLNTAYRDVMKSLPKERKVKLQDAQRAWLKFRDTNCSFYEDPEGGTAATVSSADCFMSATANRAQELELFIK